MMAIKTLVVVVWLLAIVICVRPEVGHSIHRWLRNRK